MAGLAALAGGLWLACWLAGLAGWLGWLADLLIDWLADWLIGWLAAWLVAVPAHGIEVLAIGSGTFRRRERHAHEVA